MRFPRRRFLYLAAGAAAPRPCHASQGRKPIPHGRCTSSSALPLAVRLTLQRAWSLNRLRSCLAIHSSLRAGPGPAAMSAADAVVHATPDGYTLQECPFHSSQARRMQRPRGTGKSRAPHDAEGAASRSYWVIRRESPLTRSAPARSKTMVAKAASISLALLAFRIKCRPKARVAAWSSLASASAPTELAGLTRESDRRDRRRQFVQ